jgi:hypothetical protein
MIGTMVQQPPIRPTVIVPDTAPLIHLAAANALHLLNEMGRVVLVDIVVLEATYYQDKPFAKEIKVWIDSGRLPGANAPVEVAESDLGPLYLIALEQGLKKPRHAGEIAISEWLADELLHIGGPALVVYENGLVPNLLARQGVAATVAVATTRNFLKLAEECGIITNAEAVWADIIKAAPTANPASVITFIEPSKP